MKRARWVLFPLLAVLAGCGGGGGPSSPAARQVEGTVELPAGSTLALGDLQVMTCLGTVPVETSGRFVGKQPDTGPAQAMLLDQAGHLIMLGYVDADDPKAGKISAGETAVALLFDGLAPFMPPPSYWKRVLDLIRADPLVPPLAATIAARVAVNPTALADGDAEIKAALVAALESLRPAGAACNQGRPAARLVPAQNTPLSRVTDIFPTGPHSGLELLASAGTSGAVFKNHFRRHAAWHAYRTGYMDEESDHPVTPWERAPSPPLSGISATTGVNGVIGALIDLITGQVAWAPTTTPAFELPIQPPEARKTYYTLFVVGPGTVGPQDLKQILAGYANLPAAERTRIENSANFETGITMVQEILLPFVFSVIPANNIMKEMGATEAEQAFYDIYQLLLTVVPGLATEIGHRDLAGAVDVTVKALANSSQARRKLIDLMIKKGILKFATAQSLESMGSALGKKAGGVLIVVDAVTTLFDIGTVVKDINKSQLLESWTATAWRPVVRVTPNPATVSPGTGVDILCQGVSGIEEQLIYEWSTPGTYGHLTDSVGHSGLTFDSTQPQVTYNCKTTATNGVTDTVRVTVYLKAGRQFVDSAQGVIQVVQLSGDWGLAPATRTISKLSSAGFAVTYSGPPLNLPAGAKLEYSWDATKTCGSLFTMDGSQEAPFTGGMVSAAFKSNKSTGSDTVNVRIYQVSATDERTQLGAGYATVTVKQGTMVPAKIVVWGPVYWVSGGTSTIKAGVQPMNVFEGTSEHYRVLFHAPGYYRDGQAGEVWPRMSKASCESTYGGYNVWNLTENQRAVAFYGGQFFGGSSSPPEDYATALAHFNSLYPTWQDAVNNPGIQEASKYVLEILDW